jgi:hypothetical protein
MHLSCGAEGIGDRVLRKTFGSKKERCENGEDYITKSLKACSIERYYSCDQIGEYEMRHVPCMWGKRKYTQGFDTETKGKRTFGRSRRREDNIKMGLKEIGRAWTEFIWISTGTSGRLLCKR